MRQEHGWRLTDIGWTPRLLFPQRTGALKGAVLWDTWGSELSIIALQEAESGLKQWALYHYIASLGDGTADMDGWLTMTVHDGGFKHTAQKAEHISKGSVLHRALCCLFRPDTDGTRVSKCGQLSQQTRRLDPMLFQCWSSAVGGGPILKQHWVKCSRLLDSTQVSVYTHPSTTIIFSPADQGTFSKTASQSQAYYNTWNWERGKYDVNHLHILTCEGAVSRVSSVGQSLLFTMVAGRSNGCFFMVQQPCPGSLSPGLSCQCLYNHLSHQVKRERHYKVYTRTSA